MATSRDISTLLGPALYNTIPTNTQVVLQQAWTAHTADLRTQLEKLKVDSEQKVFELEAKNEELNKKVATFTEESERGQSSLVSYREQATKTGALNTKLTEENISLSAERDGLRRQLDTAKAERDDLAGLSERRQADIERLHGDLKNLTDQLGQANNARCEAQVKVEEIESKEVNLSYREKRLEEEREFLKSQITMLQTEVEKRSEEVLQARRESGQELARINQELSEQIEDARAAKRAEESASSEADSYKRRAEELAERLREARESESKLEENYRAELHAQRKLADLYKSHSSEYNNKTEELSKAVTELQGLLSDSSEKYGQLEEKMLVEEAKNRAEVDGKVETIDALRKELEEANKLIKTFKTKGLTEEGIECLSPSAAAASRMLKSGVTITGIYSQMVTLSEELACEKEENKRLNLYLDQILLEIEERAPMLKQQREDYERAVGAVAGLTEQLESAREEAELRRGEAEEFRRTNASLEKDRNRLETMVQDLGKQVTVLVREVEESRSGHRRLRSESSQPLDTSSADAVIEGRLLTYLDVSELQQKNIELLAVVRELSAGQEVSEAKLVEERTAEVRQELDTALRQVEELRSARERQATMVESIIQQRDMYKSMCAGGSVATPTTPSKAATPKQQSPRAARLAQEAEKKVKELEIELAEAKKDFVEYKEEKAVNDRMANEQIDKMREDLMEARSNAAKLASKEEYSTEKFTILQANTAGYKRNMEALEERNRQLHSIAAKHEASVTSLRNEILDIQSKLSRAEVQADHLQHEKSMLQSSEARLLAEREVLHREKSSSSRIVANLQQIQLNLERGEEEGKARLQHLNDNLQKEAELLRKRLEAEQDQYRESVRAWEGTNRELREKVEAATAAEKAALEQMTSVSQTIETLKEELRDTSEQLQLAESRLAGRGQTLSSQSSVAEGQKGTGRLRDVELLLAQTRQEMKSVKDQLADAKKQAEQYKGIASTSETRMVETNNTMAEFKKEMEIKLEQAREEREAAEKKAGQLQAEYKEMEQKVENLEAEVGASGGELKGKLKSTTAELAEFKRKLKMSEKIEKEARQEAEKLSKSLTEEQNSYERELLLHAKDVENMNQLKLKVSAHQAELAEAKEGKRKAEVRLDKDKNYKDKINEKLKTKSSTVSEQLELVSKENAALHKQLESMSQKMSDMSAAGLNTSGGASANTSLNVSDVNKSINEDDASNEQLVAIIRYLRKEKQIIAGRFEVLQAEAARTESQLEHHMKMATDSQEALDQERKSNSQASLSGSAHAELIRKVETLSAITDSNSLLRDELTRFKTTVGDWEKKATEAEDAVKPLEIKLREVEERASNLAVEKAALQTESDKWKQRANQLIEKSHKVNPDELKKLQENRTQLGKMVTSLKKEKEEKEKEAGGLSKELEAVKGKFMACQQETKRLEKEIQEKNTENNKLSMASVTAKNATANLSKSNNDLNRRIQELEKEKNEAKSALQAAVAKHRQEITEAKKDADQSKSGQEEASKIKKELTDAKETLTSKEQEVEQLKKDFEDKNEQLNKIKNNNVQLKKIGRNFREKLTLAEEESKKIIEEKETSDATIKALKEENKKLEEENEQLKSSNEGENVGSNDDSASGRAGDADLRAKNAEAEALISQSAAEIENMSLEMEEIKAENEAMKTKMTEKEERAKKVLTNAKTKIQKVELENRELQRQLAATSGGGELQSQVSQTEEMDCMKAAFGAQINALKQAKDKEEEAKKEEIKEKEKLIEEVEKLKEEVEKLQQQERGERSKPVAVVGVVPQAPQPRKQTQPQAHIHPQRHQSRDEHRHAQTANVRPMAMRSTSQAVVLPTSQGTSQPEVATVPPTVSVSPSVSAPQIPSTSQPQQLDAAAPEFFPAGREGSSEAREAAEEPPRAVVTPRQDQPQSSTSGPSPHQPAQPSTSTAVNTTPTTASVQPTLKRPRETPDSDSQSSADERVSGPSGFQKKPRTTSSTEVAASGSQVSSAGAEDMLDAGVSGSGELEMDSSVAQDLGGYFDVEDPCAGPGESEMGGVVASSMEDDGGEEMAASSAGRSAMASANSTSASGGGSGQAASSGSSHPASSAAGLAASSTTHDDEDNDEVVVLDSENDDDMEEGEVMSCHGDDAEEPNLDGDDEQVYDAEEDDVDEEVAEDEEDDDGDEGNVTAGDEDDNGVVEVVDSEDEAEPSREQVEEANGDNSSEPSSSTGAGQQRFRPGHSTGQSGMGYGEDQGDDSVVPSTPKLILPRRNDGGFAEAVSSPQVPSSDRFTFGAGPSGSGLSGPDVIVTSSNSGLAGQEGVDRTAVDINQFASGGAGRTVPNTPQTTSPEQPEMGEDLQSEMAETLAVALGDDQSDDAVPEIHVAGDSEEGGVSSSGSAPSSQQDHTRNARTRERIVWGESGSSGVAPPASTSPVRGGAQFRGEGSGRAMARRSRGGPFARRGQ